MIKSYKTFLFSFVTWLCTLSVCAQKDVSHIVLKENANVGVIVTGEGNTLNVTQVFEKFPEYGELTKHLSRLEMLIQRKISQCSKIIY
jgi:hypothetical protein